MGLVDSDFIVFGRKRSNKGEIDQTAKIRKTEIENCTQMTNTLCTICYCRLVPIPGDGMSNLPSTEGQIKALRSVKLVSNINCLQHSWPTKVKKDRAC